MTNLYKAIDIYWGRLPASTNKLARCVDLAAVQERLHCVQGNILHNRNIHNNACVSAVTQDIANRTDSIYSIY